MLPKLHRIGCSRHSCPWTSSTNDWLNCPPPCMTHYHYWSLRGHFICVYLYSLPQLASAYKQPFCLNKQIVSHIVSKHVFLILYTLFKFMQIVLGCVSILFLTFSHYPCILKMYPFYYVCMLLVSSSLGPELHIYLSTSPVWMPRLPSIPCYINMLWQWSP